jgi:broad specificity phosphatase PhoE
MLNGVRMTTCVLVRTGEVENLHGIVPGRLPGFTLSESGRRLAEVAATRLEGAPLAAIYVSPLAQARQTCDIIARFHPNVTVYRADFLTQVRTSWQGECSGHVQPRGNYYEPRRHESDETIEDLFNRMNHLICRIITDEYPDKMVACISHRDPIGAFCLGIKREQFTMDRLRAMGDDYPSPGSLTTILLQNGHSDFDYTELT